MKRYDTRYRYDVKKHKEQGWRNEHKAGGFRCSHCRQFVVINDIMGTANRNHCNSCLWSKHVDEDKGDRRSDCHGGMRPVGMTFKNEGYGRQGEIMLVHSCVICSKLSINRIARDDYDHKVVDVFELSITNDTYSDVDCASAGIRLMSRDDTDELHAQLYGRQEKCQM